MLYNKTRYDDKTISDITLRIFYPKTIGTKKRKENVLSSFLDALKCLICFPRSITEHNVEECDNQLNNSISNWYRDSNQHNEEECIKQIVND